MELSFKPDLGSALEHWRALWNHDIIKRPCTAVVAPKDGAKQVPGPPSQVHPDSDFGALIDQAEANMSGLYFAGEAMPFFEPSFGPDQAAAFIGGPLDYSEHSAHTSWSVPFVDSWDDVLPFELGQGNSLWEPMLEFCRLAGERGQGKFLVGALDMHSNLDWLAAVRDPVLLCMDIMDDPATVQRALANVRELYREMYEALYEAGAMAGRGSIGWLPYYSEGRYATVQCDFACLLSPAQFDEFVLPALAEECDLLDHTVYHYDGAVALQHFDSITGIKSLDGIQWTPGAGAKPMIEWIDLLQRFQERGKNVYVGCSPDELKVFHKQLKPNLVFYRVSARSQKEADDILVWLEQNT